MAMREPVPRWFSEFDQERRASRSVSDRETARQSYREELMADAVRQGRYYAELLRSAFVDRSELTAADIGSLRAGALEIAMQLSAIETALRYSESL